MQVGQFGTFTPTYFLKGLRLTYESLKNVISNKETILPLLKMASGLFLATFILTWIRHMILSIFWWVVSFIPFVKTSPESFPTLLLQSSFLISAIATFIVRLFLSEEIFFRYLRSRDFEKSEVLKSMPTQTLQENIHSFFMRLMKYMKMLFWYSLLVVVDKLLPFGIGAAVGVYLLNKKYFGKPVAIILALSMTLNPTMRRYILSFLHLFNGARALGAEFANPWASRMEKATSKSILKTTTVSSMLIGVGLPFLLFTATPFIAPLALAIGQAAGAELALQIGIDFEDEDEGKDQ